MFKTVLAVALAWLVAGAANAQQTYRIGLSNGWVGSEWRTQMVEEAQAAAAAWKARGVNVEVVVAATSVVVGVHDQDRVTSLQTPYGDREGGWGLGLVGALAHSWSMVSHPQGGKTVWFRLLRAEAHSVSNGAAARTDADRRDS